MNDSILVVRRRIDRIELQIIGLRSIQNIVASTRRYDEGETVMNFILMVVDHARSLALFTTKKLIGIVMDLRADFFPGFQAHQD